MVNFNPDLENTKEGILHVCDKPNHNIKENLPQWEGLENGTMHCMCVKVLQIIH